MALQKQILCLNVLLFFSPLAGASLSIAPVHEPTLRQGSYTRCSEGKSHKITYSLLHTLGDDFDNVLNLDTFYGVTSAHCGVDSTKLRVQFDSLTRSTAFYAELKLFNYFITTRRFCRGSGVVLRRVINAALSEHGYAVNLHTAEAKYTDMFQAANVSAESDHHSSKCGGSKDRLTEIPDEIDSSLDEDLYCIGVGTDDYCTGPGKDSTHSLVENDFVSVKCTKCYASFAAGFYFHMEIQNFGVHKISAGFKNLTLNSQWEIDIESSKTWSTAPSKQISDDEHPILQFNLGPIPFEIASEGSLNLMSNLSFYDSAWSKIGASFNHQFGDVFMVWERHEGWRLIGVREGCPMGSDLEGCPLSSRNNFYCPADKKCYGLYQNGCSGDLCPPFNEHISKPDFQTSLRGLPTVKVGGAFYFHPSVSLNVGGVYSFVSSFKASMDFHILPADMWDPTLCLSGSFNGEMSYESSLFINADSDWITVSVNSTSGKKVLWSMNGAMDDTCVAIHELTV